ncbi:CsbD family protein [Methylobacterium sp. WL116]|uniref:CsbD family protein n=1 Tax=Methylobacterium sp. WL116 TaxID=2603889 RepID=UPI0011C913F9|nr:CsbD family protein [Methylobacterium sp. WL116]TXM90524.1 CsbD family protein [Methylobacterium sp. WL116]
MDRIKGVANEATGNVKQGIGDVTGDRGLKAEGKVQELKGRAQQGVGEAKDAIENAKSKF